MDHHAFDLLRAAILTLWFLLYGCGPAADPPPAPDAGVIAEPSHETPVACLPWPCPDGGPP